MAINWQLQQSMPGVMASRISSSFLGIGASGVIDLILNIFMRKWREIMIFITFKILIGFIITLFYIYWKFVYFSPNGTFEYTSVFLNKFLITKDSKLNKLYPTKKNSSYRPRIIQTAIMLFVTIITLILILISFLIMIILKENVLTTYVYYFSIITAILGFSINIVVLIIKITQMYSCKKKEKLMSIDEINKVMVEISNKQPEFYR